MDLRVEANVGRCGGRPSEDHHTAVTADLEEDIRVGIGRAEIDDAAGAGARRAEIARVAHFHSQSTRESAQLGDLLR
jgi:hypothetical protein